MSPQQYTWQTTSRWGKTALQRTGESQTGE